MRTVGRIFACAACALVACVAAACDAPSDTARTTSDDRPRHVLVDLAAVAAPGEVFLEGGGLIRPARSSEGGEEGWTLAIGAPDEIDAWRRAGARVKALASPHIRALDVDPKRIDSCDAKPAPGAFCAYDVAIGRCPQSIADELVAMPSTHPAIGGVAYVTTLDLGATAQGRRIRGVRIGRFSQSSGKPLPQLVVLAAQHAREWGASEMAMRLARYFADAYRDDRDGVRSLLADRAIAIVPVANPDGFAYSFTTDRLWRTSREACVGDPSSFGTDLNRNMPFAWGEVGAAAVCASNEESTFRGASSASAPESRAALALMGSTGAYRTAYVVNTHTYGNFALFPDGYSAGLSPCTTTSNCTAPDFAAHRAFVGSDRTTDLHDEENGRPYSIEQMFRGMYAASGETLTQAVYGTFEGGAPNSLGELLELTNTDCGMRAELLPSSQLDAVATTYRTHVVRAMQRLRALDDGSWYESNAGRLALPHVHRRADAGVAVEYPALRLSALRSIGALSFGPLDGSSGTSGPDDVRDGVAYRMWAWHPLMPYRFPRKTMVCEKQSGCRVARIESAGGDVDLCDPRSFPTHDGWRFTGRGATSPGAECEWSLAPTASPTSTLSSGAAYLGDMHSSQLVYSWRGLRGQFTRARVMVSTNGFVGCSTSAGTGCRIVRQYPNPDVYDLRDATLRTEIVDVADFDGAAGVEVRFEVVGVASFLAPHAFDVLDVVFVGWGG